MEKIKTFVDNKIMNNTYLLIKDGKCLIIDPSFTTKKIISYIKEENLELLAILLTHGHYDHFAGVDILGEIFNCDYYISEEDEGFLSGYESKFFGHEVKQLPKFYPDYHLDIGDFHIELMKVPGHTPGSVILIYEDKMFTGDFLFAGGIGRTDLPKGSVKDMQKSLEMLKDIKVEYYIYPGHEETSVLSKELKRNPYLR